MTGHLPRRPIEPLPPPPDGFGRVYREATFRRFHRAAAVCGVTGVFLSGIFGGLALGGGVSGVRNTIVNVARGGSPSPSVSTSTAAPETRQASVVPSTAGRKTAAPVTSSAVTAPPERVAPTFVRGRVVDPSGAPVAGLYVWTGEQTAKGYLPTRLAATTDVTGAYRVPCTGAPVLVTSWRVNTNLGPAAVGVWAPMFVDDLSCTRGTKPRVTTLVPGAVVQGRVRTDVSCPDARFPLWLWIDGQRTSAVRLSGLGEGDRYRIAGAPVGTSVLGARGRTTDVTTTAGRTVEQDVTFACPTAPATTAEPTTTPAPTPAETTTTPTPTDPTPSTSTSSPAGTSSSSPPPTTGR